MPQPSALIIDSDKAAADALASMFAARGVKVYRAPDGHQGLQLAYRHYPTLIVLAVELPALSGYSVCKKLKRTKQTADIPVALLSSTASTETFEQHQRLRTRAEFYFFKPVEAEVLWEQVHGVFGAEAREERGGLSGSSIDIDLDDMFGAILDEAELGSSSESSDASADSSPSASSPRLASPGPVATPRQTPTAPEVPSSDSSSGARPLGAAITRPPVRPPGAGPRRSVLGGGLEGRSGGTLRSVPGLASEAEVPAESPAPSAERQTRDMPAVNRPDQKRTDETLQPARGLGDSGHQTESAISTRDTGQKLNALPRGAGDSLRLEVNILMAQIERQESTTKSLRRSLATTETRAEDYRQRLEAQILQTERLEARIVERDREVDELRREVAALRAHQASGADSAVEHQLRVALDAAREERAQERGALHQELADAREDAQRTRAALAALQARWSELEERAGALERELYESAEVWRQEREAMAETQIRLSELVARMEEAAERSREELDAARAALIQAQAEREQLLAELHDARAQAGDGAVAVDTLRADLDAALARSREREEALAAARHELLTVTGQRDRLDALLAEASGGYHRQLQVLQGSFEALTAAHTLAIDNLRSARGYAETLEERLFTATEVLARIGGMLGQITGVLGENREDLAIPEGPEYEEIPQVVFPELTAVEVYSAGVFRGWSGDATLSEVARAPEPSAAVEEELKRPAAVEEPVGGGVASVELLRDDDVEEAGLEGPVAEAPVEEEVDVVEIPEPQEVDPPLDEEVVGLAGGAYAEDASEAKGAVGDAGRFSEDELEEAFEATAAEPLAAAPPGGSSSISEIHIPLPDEGRPLEMSAEELNRSDGFSLLEDVSGLSDDNLLSIDVQSGPDASLELTMEHISAIVAGRVDSDAELEFEPISIVEGDEGFDAVEIPDPGQEEQDLAESALELFGFDEEPAPPTVSATPAVKPPRPV